jgi:hypothetical protein
LTERATVLLDAGLIGPTVFSALVAMAIAWTVVAAPEPGPAAVSRSAG